MNVETILIQNYHYKNGILDDSGQNTVVDILSRWLGCDRDR